VKVAPTKIIHIGSVYLETKCGIAFIFKHYNDAIGSGRQQIGEQITPENGDTNDAKQLIVLRVLDLDFVRFV
jgi:hypothetical protein